MDELLAMAYRTVIANVDDRIMFAIHGLRGADAVQQVATSPSPFASAQDATSPSP